MNIPIIVFPNGLHLNINTVSTFTIKDYNDDCFSFHYTLIGLEKENTILISNEFRVLLNQKLNYICEITELKKRH